MSKRSSLIKLELELEPLIYTKNEIPKSINKLTGIVSIKIANKNKAPNIQIKIDVLVMITIIELIKKELITTKKRIAKKKNHQQDRLLFHFRSKWIIWQNYSLMWVV